MRSVASMSLALAVARTTLLVVGALGESDSEVMTGGVLPTTRLRESELVDLPSPTMTLRVMVSPLLPLPFLPR